MGLRNWWAGVRQRPALSPIEAAARNPALIASQVPELAGMPELEGMAYTFREIERWRSTASPKEWRELQRRRGKSIAYSEAKGLVMPYWGDLWLLRTYQRQLGQDVPWVAPVGKTPSPK